MIQHMFHVLSCVSVEKFGEDDALVSLNKGLGIPASPALPRSNQKWRNILNGGSSYLKLHLGFSLRGGHAVSVGEGRE